MRAVPMKSFALSLAVALLATAGLLVNPAVEAQEATPAAGAECPETTPEENAALVSAFIDSWDGPEADLAAVYAADHFHEGANDRLYEGAMEWLAAQRAQYPDLAVTIDEIVADADTVAVIVTWSGTLAGEDIRFGFPATGVHTEWGSAVFYQMECGKIAESWSLADNLSRLRDSGAVTDEEISSVDAVTTPAP